MSAESPQDTTDCDEAIRLELAALPIITPAMLVELAAANRAIHAEAEGPSVTLHWHCGCYVGPCKWQTLNDYEPDECNTDFTTEDSLENWNDRVCGATCPTCGAELTQKYDEPTMTVNQISTQ